MSTICIAQPGAWTRKGHRGLIASPCYPLPRKEPAISKAVQFDHVSISGGASHVPWLSGSSPKLKLSLGFWLCVVKGVDLINYIAAV